jgi:hypothetical protein
MKEVTKTFLSGKLSATLIIPIETARRYGLEQPSHVVVEERDEGILIRRIEIWCVPISVTIRECSFASVSATAEPPPGSRGYAKQLWIQAGDHSKFYLEQNKIWMEKLEKCEEVVNT